MQNFQCGRILHIILDDRKQDAKQRNTNNKNNNYFEEDLFFWSCKFCWLFYIQLRPSKKWIWKESFIIKANMNVMSVYAELEISGKFLIFTFIYRSIILIPDITKVHSHFFTSLFLLSPAGRLILCTIQINFLFIISDLLLRYVILFLQK